MNEWKKYDSKPIVREAYRINSTDEILLVPIEATSSIVIEGEYVLFKHYEEVKVGDYIVRLTKDDTYHCDKDVFEDRNVIPGTEVKCPVDPIMKFFKYDHLPPHLQEVSKPFCLLAHNIIKTVPSNTEREHSLRKLLLAKDAAVRALI